LFVNFIFSFLFLLLFLILLTDPVLVLLPGASLLLELEQLLLLQDFSLVVFTLSLLLGSVQNVIHIVTIRLGSDVVQRIVGLKVLLEVNHLFVQNF